MINLVLILWILACVIFVVWSSGKLDACDVIVWAKGTWHKKWQEATGSTDWAPSIEMLGQKSV